MIRGRYTLYFTVLSLSVIFMLGFFKESFVMDAHTFGTRDPPPQEIYGIEEGFSSKNNLPSVKAYSRKLLNGRGKILSKKSPFSKNYFFKFTDMREKGLKNPIQYGVELYKLLLSQEYEMDGVFDWSIARKYNPRLTSFPNVKSLQHTIAPDFKIGDALPTTAVRQIHIATSWRSGSTFLGDLLNHIMGTYYSFEPLHFESLTMPTDRRLDLMKSIYRCDFKNKEVIGWLKHVTKRENNFLFVHNFRSHKICENLLPGKVACYMDKFQDPLCSMSPIRVIKTVRLRVEDSEFFLKNPKDFPNYKMIVLVRDPRGTMHSRSHRNWCNGVECINSTVVCNNLEKDAESAYELSKKYPGRVYLIRYEDVCIDPHKEVKSLFKFLDIPLNSGLQAFIKSHMFMKAQNQNPYSTFRNSNTMYMKWRKSVDMSYIDKIQKDCSVPMETLGYHPFTSPIDRDDFNISVLSKKSESIWPKNLS